MLLQLVKEITVLGRKCDAVNIKYRVQRSLVFVHNLPPASLPANSRENEYASGFTLIDLGTKSVKLPT